MKHRIEGHWESFLEKVVPSFVTTLDPESMRQIFFAGAWAMHAEIYGSGEEDDEAGLQGLQELDNEMLTFRIEMSLRAAFAWGLVEVVDVDEVMQA